MSNVAEALIESATTRRLLLLEAFAQEHTKCSGIDGVAHLTQPQFLGKEKIECVCGAGIEVTIVPVVEVRRWR